MKILKAAVFVIMIVCFASSLNAATVTGVIKYEGEVPALKPIGMDADPICASHHTGPILPEILVLGESNTMANILVYVKNAPAKDYPVPQEEVVLDQKGCVYNPHVLGIRKGQNLKILNPDGTLHNIHALSKANSEFNMAMPKFRTELTKTFDAVEAPFSVKCDVHPWMSGWIAVFDHPYFSVTGKDGVFKIEGLDAGTYEIEAWHEKLGVQTFSVTVSADETKSQDLVFKKP